MYRVVVVGLGRVSSELLDILSQRDFPADTLDIVSVDEDIGKRITYNEEETLIIKDVAKFDFSDMDFAFFCAGDDISRKYAEQVGALGVAVIDCSAVFRMDSQVPLVVPELNLESLQDYRFKGIVSSPNCTSIQLALVLAPLHRQFGVVRAVVSTYQSVSGAGSEALEELFDQTRGIYINRPIFETKKIFTKQIAFNVIPHIGKFLEDSYTEEELKMIVETNRILNSQIVIDPTCVRVSVFIGHALSLNIELEERVTKEEIKDIFSRSAWLAMADYDMDEGYATPVEVAGEDQIYISRIRVKENIVNLWVVGDNLRKGAALNMVQIAEEIVKLRA